MKHTALAAIAIAAAFATPCALANENDIFTTWKTHKGGFVAFAACQDDNSKVCGHVSGLAPDHRGPPPTDIHNSDPALQSRPLLGLQLFDGFEYVGNDRWKNGTIYNTDDGKTYDSKLRLEDDGQLQIKGCVLFVCQTYHWQPAPDAVPEVARDSSDCAADDNSISGICAGE